MFYFNESCVFGIFVTSVHFCDMSASGPVWVMDKWALESFQLGGLASCWASEIGLEPAWRRILN